MASLRAEYRLLDRAVRYAMSAAGHASPQLLTVATPCAEWDLRMLLSHLGDSLDALAEGLLDRRVGPAAGCPGAVDGPSGALSAAGPARPAGGGADLTADLIADLAGRARALLRACADVRSGQDVVAVADRRLTTSVVAITGAIEVAVHGWDISVTCGDRTPVPGRLASELLPYAALLVPRRTRPGLFADPVQVPRQTSAGDRLVAFLGRQPGGVRPGRERWGGRDRWPGR